MKKKIAKSRELAAFDDAVLVFHVPDEPVQTNHRQVGIRNLNTSRAIVANLIVKCSDPYPVTNLRFNRSNLFPHSFEVRVPPGGTYYIGDNVIARIHSMKGFPKPKSYYPVQYEILGARYVAEEPTPLPAPSEAENCLFMYQLPHTSGPHYYFINRDHVFGVSIDFHQEPKSPSGIYASISLENFRHRLCAYSIGTITSFKITSAKFHDPRPMPMLPGDTKAVIAKTAHRGVRRKKTRTKLRSKSNLT
ncbi:hypothetical protein FNB15_02555 [Ferrovibrio terrae]|uniref:Uncharacterized protein n=1 Tax=Ferrovibrio terrae TaxID=2594003 RepID=A0A516GXK5_9PROT|nr:hypothetical protein [Ferrovibrio terrae]QDO96227.1 hypothetical protein FNB15_02555 [Ferrovibrio terrae]